MTQEIGIVESHLFDMYGRELERDTGRILPNGLQHFGAKIIVRLDEGWYDFTHINPKDAYIKVCTLKCDTDRKAVNRALKIDPTIKRSNVYVISNEKEMQYRAKFKEDFEKELDKK